eukprot:795588-Prorocentrum_minimum.AAC.1
MAGTASRTPAGSPRSASPAERRPSKVTLFNLRLSVSTGHQEPPRPPQVRPIQSAPPNARHPISSREPRIVA